MTVKSGITILKFPIDLKMINSFQSVDYWFHNDSVLHVYSTWICKVHVHFVYDYFINLWDDEKEIMYIEQNRNIS